MPMFNWSRFPINVPNTITIVRILLTPLFIILLLKDMVQPALLTFAAAGISDGLDGFIARTTNQRTELGAHLDPLADKLLLMAAFICLGALKSIPTWLSVVVISRDVVIVMGIALLNLNDISVKIQPSLVSKATTVFQLVTVFVILAPWFPQNGMFRSFLFYGTGLLTVVSGLHYMYVGINLLQQGMDEKHH